MNPNRPKFKGSTRFDTNAKLRLRNIRDPRDERGLPNISATNDFLTVHFYLATLFHLK
jgi:hypothetical protein